MALGHDCISCSRQKDVYAFSLCLHLSHRYGHSTVPDEQFTRCTHARRPHKQERADHEERDALANLQPRACVADIKEEYECHHCAARVSIHHVSDLKQAPGRTIRKRERDEEEREGRKAESAIEDREGSGEDNIGSNDLKDL